MSMAWVAQQLSQSAMARSLPLKQERFNPRPAGVLRDTGAAKAVLEFLQAHPKQFFTFSQLLHATGRTAKALDWACIFLRSLGHVECSRDEGRNSRYLRYRAVTRKDTDD